MANAVLEDLVERIKKTYGENASKSESVANGQTKTKPKNRVVGFYDPTQGCYWMENARGQWQKTNETHFKRFLAERTYKAVANAEGKRSMIENHIIETQHNLDVAYAGPLAGWTCGLHEICGQRVLVTREVHPVQPKKMEWAQLYEFIETLLPQQSQYFYGWLKSSMASLKAGGPFRPGQALAIAGPAGCGKSLLQNLLTEVFGGRSAKPFKFIVGRTDFNHEHFAAEHLMIEDEAASTDIRTRRDMGSAIKSLIVNETQACYRKSKEPVMLMPFWRLTISLNDEAENLMVLPPLDDSLRDKIIMLKACPAVIPYDSQDVHGRKLWRASLSSQLPGLLHWLTHWRLPAELVDVRYGSKAFQHPDLLDALEDLSPEGKLMNLIDALSIWPAGMSEWSGTANELEDKLLEKDKLGRVQKLLSFNTACGVYLARLAKRFPDRCQAMTREKNRSVWNLKKAPEVKLPQ